MAPLDSPTSGAAATARGLHRPACAPGRLESAGAIAAAAVGIGIVIAWEVAGPRLPAPFELGISSRAPGVPAWALRLPMAAAALGALCAFYTFVRRSANRSSGGYAVAVLATVPAWFVHGRTMTGAMVPMACSAVVLAGLGIAVLDDRATPRARRLALGVAALAVLVSVLASRWGAPARGLAAVAAVPAIAVGAAGMLWTNRRGARAVLAAGLVVGGAAVTMAALGREGWWTDTLLGSRAAVVGKVTFEAPVAALAYGLVPWTPLVPFALARRPKSAAHLAMMIAAVLAIAVHAALAPRTGATTLVGVAAIAGAVAMMLREVEDTARPAAALVATMLAIGWLVAHDVKLAPERIFLAFGTSDAALPAAHAAASSLAIRSSLWLCMALSSVALVVPRTWLPAGRGLAIVAAGVFAGLVLRAHAYPELLARLSPVPPSTPGRGATGRASRSGSSASTRAPWRSRPARRSSRSTMPPRRAAGSRQRRTARPTSRADSSRSEPPSCLESTRSIAPHTVATSRSSAAAEARCSWRRAPSPVASAAIIPSTRSCWARRRPRCTQSVPSSTTASTRSAGSSSMTPDTPSTRCPAGAGLRTYASRSA